MYKELLQHGADVNLRNEQGWNPVFEAVANNKVHNGALSNTNSSLGRDAAGSIAK